MELRVHVDTPAGGVVGNRIELLSGSVTPAPSTLTATCGGQEIPLRPCVHPDVRFDTRVQGFWGFLVLQELVGAVRGGMLAIEVHAAGRHAATVRLRVAPAAAHLARAYPVSLQEYDVAPAGREHTPPTTLVFPGLGGVGGASLNQLFRMKAHHEGWQVPVYFEADEPTLWSAMRAHAPAPYRWIDGHGCHGAADDLGERFARITFLREPVRRLRSVFRYAALVHPRACPFATLDEFVETGAARGYTQAAGLVRCAGGDPMRLTDAELARSARRQLERDYAFVGITELFEESIFLVCRLAGYASIGMWSRVLAAPRTSNPDHLTLRTRRRLEEVAAADTELYERARERLAERLGADDLGDGFRRYKADAARQVDLPDVYKLRECLRWRAFLERGVDAGQEARA